MAARFKRDESLPRDAAALFRHAGFDCDTVLDEKLGGQTDTEVFAVSQREQRVFVTFDLDFADIRRYPPAAHAGVWVLRPETQSIGRTLTLLRGALALLEREPVNQRLWILESERIRIRS